MNLKSIVSDGHDLLAMAPEDLAIAVLRSLNSVDDNARRRGQPALFRFTQYCNTEAEKYSSVPQVDVVVAIAAALQHLMTIGMLVPSPHASPWGTFQLTGRAKAVKDAADYQRYRLSSSYPRGLIHPAIERNSYSEFMKGDYDTAVFKAFKTLEDTVRTRAGYGHEKIGVPMMRAAFRPDGGPLTDKTEEEGERDSLMHLMAGALGRFKNPTSHRFTGLDDPAVAIEILQLASLLLRIAEQRPAIVVTATP